MEFREGPYSVLWNVLGGIIVAGLTLLCRALWSKLRRRRFRQVFGDDVENDFYVIYPAYEVTFATGYRKPTSRVSRLRPVGGINLTAVNSTAGTRGVSHIAYAVGDYARNAPNIQSDHQMDDRMDISFVSIGGITNFKSLDLFDNAKNVFLDFSFEQPAPAIVSKQSKSPIVRPTKGIDYGLIIKINPSINEARTWICCAGFAEWGTSGAAWWLAHRWKQIRKKAKNLPFACITKTRIGSDDSTELLHFFGSGKDAAKPVGLAGPNKTKKSADTPPSTTVSEVIPLKRSSPSVTAPPPQDEEDE